MAFGNRLIDTGGDSGGATLGSFEGATAIGGKWFSPTYYPNGRKSFQMSEDGSKFILKIKGTLWEINASGNPLSIEDAPYRTKSSFAGNDNFSTAVTLNEDGTIIQYATYDSPGRRIVRHELYQGFNVDTIINQTATGFLPAPAGATTVVPYAVGLSRDGQYMITYAYRVEGVYTKKLDVYTLNQEHNAPYGYTLLHSVSDFSFADTQSSYGNPARSIKFNNNGKIMYIVTNDSGVFQYNLTTAYDPNTASYSGFSLNYGGEHNDIAFSADYSWIMLGGEYSTIYAWNLVTP